MTAIPTIATPIVPAPLRPRPDIGELWTSHAKPISFERAANLVLDAHADDGDPDDIVATDLRTWAFGSNDHRIMQLLPIALPGRPQSGPVALRDLAFNQLAARIGAPPSYIRELPEKLQIANINYGMTVERRSALLRLAGNEVRAVVSEKYVALDDELLLEVAGDVLHRAGYLADAVVRVTAVGLSTVLRITLPGEGVAVRAGDTIEYGLDIGNSEVGLRSVQVTPITYRLICTNGMRAWRSEAAMRMRHVGDPKRLQDALRDAIPVAFAEARGDIAKWRRAVDVLIDSALDVRGELSLADRHRIERWLVEHADERVASALDALSVEWRETRADEQMPRTLRVLSAALWPLVEEGRGDVDPDPIEVPALMRGSAPVVEALTVERVHGHHRRVRAHAHVAVPGSVVVATSDDTGAIFRLFAGHATAGPVPISHDYDIAVEDGRVTFWLLAGSLDEPTPEVLLALVEAGTRARSARAVRITPTFFEA